MPFAIELMFDSVSDASIRHMGLQLEQNGVPTSFSIKGSSPHFALSVFEEYETTPLLTGLKKVASSTPPLRFQLSSLGTFPGKEGALFLAPSADPALLDLHMRVHRLIKGRVQGPWTHYAPGHWFPHCTVGINLSPIFLTKGYKVLQKKDFSMNGTCDRLTLVEFRPGFNSC